MRCDRYREAVSARLDGEPLGLSPSALETHLAACPDCARWAEDAARATRLARLDVTPVPDLAAAITTAVAQPARRVLRARHLLRAALLVVGVVQLAVGIPALVGDDLGMAMSAHGAHEGAAWNLAVGVAFVAVASVPRRAAGLIPLLATFTVVLAVLSVHDFAAGTVTAGRLATHAAVLVGLVLLLALDRAERALPPGRSWSARSRGRGEGDAGDGDGPTDLRTVA
ncbi:Predicted anti-sigma-YlaC factor YlaD, contains Zn-finger domain [Jatrophihabitans endophyticus]|uniref:Predicted anti-sigma-YlaC factor YlaD, contains Zn-finger domain n=1 Tax=Jatrophihabitans endophyticus TaxID=1206085 RepID=A0A1M5RWK1_9ACTN|nr:zf-HC2 domain-containing protein [Jatrophihabitans endophyticus]SHH30727.1 Predicted anti-sigma-YlaC factor YlaD, contains Zn-finger domain [Jatrophihabitans endophyticus]